METVGTQRIWSFFDRTKEPRDDADNATIRQGEGHKVNSYLELARKVAQLQFLNRDHVVLFRGQGRDYRDDEGQTTLKPTILRSMPGRNDYPGAAELARRFSALKRAEQKLARDYTTAGFADPVRLTRQHILRWTILQHYEICPTPLLDVTHSLRIAASFGSGTPDQEAFLYVLAVPNLSGAITASAEAGLQIVRLSSVCPPDAVRPHIQEGYLLGEYPDLGVFEQKALYDYPETDFGRRMIAKFRFKPSSFWDNSIDFPQIDNAALYPDIDSDPLFRLAEKIRQTLNRT